MQFSRNIIKEVEWGWHVACMGDVRNVFNALAGKPDRKYGDLDVTWKIVI
jgi:hypothetical protein